MLENYSSYQTTSSGYVASQRVGVLGARSDVAVDCGGEEDYVGATADGGGGGDDSCGDDGEGTGRGSHGFSRNSSKHGKEMTECRDRTDALSRSMGKDHGALLREEGYSGHLFMGEYKLTRLFCKYVRWHHLGFIKFNFEYY